jgi:hypothetical protein
MRIFWLASYPRSGNTWLRFLIYAYLYGPIENTADVNLRIPPIHRPPPPGTLKSERVISKTHFQRTPMHPLLEHTAGIIHIRRHPKDVLLSGLNYHALNGFTLDPARYAQLFISRLGDPEWARMGFGTWESNTTSWLGADAATPTGEGPSRNDGIPRVWTTYERLRAETPTELARILALLGESVDQSRLAEAVERCSIDNLRALEEREAQAGAKGLFPGAADARAKGHRFMNKGASGQTLAHIDPNIGKELDARFDAAFAPVLARCGYA